MNSTAYSVRKLFSGYTGPCVRVERSDGKQADIAFGLEGLKDFADGKSVKVVYWYDQSGSQSNLAGGKNPLLDKSVEAHLQ